MADDPTLLSVTDTVQKRLAVQDCVYIQSDSDSQRPLDHDSLLHTDNKKTARGSSLIPGSSNAFTLFDEDSYPGADTNVNNEHDLQVHLPRLVFKEPDENISQVNEVSDYTFNSDIYISNAVPTRAISSQISATSSDSDLLIEHGPVSGDMGTHLDGEMEQFNLEGDMLKSWHCHSAKKIPVNNQARNQLIAVSILCFLFMVGEGIGGFLANSLALFTDVLHLGSDLISFWISLLSMYLAKKPATKNMSFGYHRAEVVGALISVFIIWSVTGVLVYVAIERIIHKHYMDVKPDEMLITAVLGVVFNIVMGIVLHSEICCGGSRSVPSFGHGHSHGGHGHSHHHGDSDSHTSHPHSNSYHGNISHRSRPISSGNQDDDSYQPLLSDSDNLQVAEPSSDTEVVVDVEDSTKKHPKNINVRAAFIHVIGDLIQSLGVLLASLIIKLNDDAKYRLADPICTFLFSILVLFTTITVIRDTMGIIMEGVPRGINYYSIKTSLQKLEGVKAVHGLAVWCLTLEKNALAVHLAVDPTVDQKAVLRRASSLLQQEYNFIHTTIQVEDFQAEVMPKCSDCTELYK